MIKKQKNQTRETTTNKQLINHIGNILVSYCYGCEKIDKHFVCTIYNSPIDRCRIGCSFSPIAKAKIIEREKTRDKQRIGQQKQKKKK